MSAFSDPRWFDREGAVEREDAICRAVPLEQGGYLERRATQSGAPVDVATLRVVEGPLAGRHAGLLVWPPRRPGDLERAVGPLAEPDGLDGLEQRLATSTVRCRLETSPFGDLEVRRVEEVVAERPLVDAAGPTPISVPDDLLPERPVQPPATRVQVLTDTDAVKEAARLLDPFAVLALDIETACTRLPPERREERDAFEPWNGTVRLVQVAAAAPEGLVSVVVDAWAADPLPLLRLLGDPERRVIAHNAKFEQSWVKYRWDIEFGDVTDTLAWWMVIAGHLRAADYDHGIEDGRLVSLVERFVGLELDKSFQTSDWAAEELSAGQLEYAGLDAAVLLPLADILSGMGERLGCERQAIAASRAGARRAAISTRLGGDRRPDEGDEALAMVAAAGSAADLSEAGAIMRRMVLRADTRDQVAAAFRTRRAALAGA